MTEDKFVEMDNSQRDALRKFVEMSIVLQDCNIAMTNVLIAWSELYDESDEIEGGIIDFIETEVLIGGGGKAIMQLVDALKNWDAWYEKFTSRIVVGDLP